MTSGILAALAVLAGSTLGGYSLVRLLGGDLLRRERLAWSMACGLLILAKTSALLMAVRLAPGPKKFAAVLAVLVLASFAVRRPGRNPSFARPREGASFLPGALALLSVLAVLLFAVQAVRGGMWAPEYVAVWGLKAKMIFASASIPPRLFHDPALAFSHPSYPLLLPLCLAAVASGIRAWDIHALALLFPFLALATVLVVGGFLSRRLSWVAGAAGGLLVAVCAALYAPGNVGTSEIPMALGFALAATAFLDAVERETAGAWARLFLASLFCAATKPEGSLFAVVLLLTLCGRALRTRRFPRLAALALLLPVILHAVGMRVLRGAAPATGGFLFSDVRAVELPARMREALLQIVGIDTPHAALVLLAVAILLLASRPGIGDSLIGAFGLQLTVYAAVSIVSARIGFSEISWTLFPGVVLVAVARALGNPEASRSPDLDRSRGALRVPVAVGLLILALLALPAALQSLVGEKRLGSSVARPTFHASVEPILQAHCQTCHRAGGIGPFPLMSYADAESESERIAQQVSSRRMPPWKAGEACGDFTNDPSLSQAEIATIARWVEGGSPEGHPLDAAPPRHFSDGWELGTPDLVLQAPEFSPDFSQGDIYQCFVVPTNLDSNQWVAAVEVKPGNRAMVHHALLYVEEGIASRDLDEAAPGPGYPCFGGPRAPVTDSFGEWAPGMQPRFYPTGVARFLPRKSRIIMQVHYSALFGAVLPDRSEVGVYFAKEPITRRLLSNDVRADGPFTIPAGAVSHTLRGRLGPLASRAELVAILPHMHLLGKTMQVMARFPDGSRHCLVDVEDWDLRWQRTYFYKTPVVLPAGTMLELSATFDNSYANPNNPNEPLRDVFFGEHTTDEMCMALLFWTVDGKNPGERDAFFRGEVCAPSPTPTPASR
ncbi:MAG: hypothetical protein ABI968_06670 [Acidobacteriota bacterium]